MALIPSPGGRNDGYARGHCSDIRQPAAIMKRRSHRILSIAAAACALFVCNAAAQEPCKLTAIGSAKVAAVRDGRTLLLADGRELRLAGIEVTGDSRAALQSSGRRPSASAGTARRRNTTAMAGWSRSLSSAMAEQSVQQAMLEQGHARVSARAGRQSLRRRAFERGTRGAGGRARALGRSKFRPFVGRKSCPVAGRARPVSRWWKARSCRCARAGPLYM